MQREIVFDTETTGLSPQEGHRIIEIGALEVVGHLPTGRVFHHYLNPDREIEAGAIRVHGITNERVKDCPRFADIAQAWLDFVGDSPLVAHNASFDMNFINYELAAVGLTSLTNPVIDTLQMARQKFPGSPASLDALCRRFEVDLTARTYHGALLDAQLLAEVYLELCGGLQPTLGILGASQDLAAATTATPRPGTVYRPPRPAVAPTAAEMAAHQAFLQQSKKPPLWLTLLATVDAT